MRPTISRKTAAVVAAGVTGLAVVTGSGYAYAGPGFGDNNIHGCIGTDGRLRVAETCRRGELGIDWQARGKDGARGATGPAGAAGPTGASGQPGGTGATGAEGVAGARGLQGERGAQGEPGLPGETGAQGPGGERGEAGAQGAKGDTGARGAEGDKGATGDQGPKGDTGPSGASAELRQVEDGWFFDDADETDYVVSCPEGTRLVSGGAEIHDTFGYHGYDGPQLLGSRPDLVNDLWTARVTNFNGYPAYLRLYAICQTGATVFVDPV